MREKHAKKACLIGLGLITQRYIQGLEKAPLLSICAVSDINENAVNRKLYNEYPFYSDYKQMIKNEAPDYAIISTPPQSHFEIASFCLKNGINVIIEKPVTLCIEDFDTLIGLAEQNRLIFRTFFHWHGGIETNAFDEKYDLSQIEEIKVFVSDPYCSDAEIINSAQRPLMGAWIDSGVNSLSMIRRWLPFEKFEILKTETQKCKETNLPIYVKADLIIDGIKTNIVIDWRLGKDKKETFVKIEGRWVHLDHSGQLIEDGSITEYARMPRLNEHYKYLFETFEEKSNTEFSRSVHKTLFEVNEVL